MADLTAQMILVNGIRLEFPDDLIIAEEDESSLKDPSIRAEISQILEAFFIKARCNRPHTILTV